MKIWRYIEVMGPVSVNRFASHSATQLLPQLWPFNYALYIDKSNRMVALYQLKIC